ncbi:MAG: hypothetical protein JSU87_09805 [Gemmatimonadota bacterium]|nr:MAG: hypothetical protein JSU87_09805 [Gemmatimonadota bacterium]
MDTARHDLEPAPTRVSGVASRAVVRLLSERGVPANELVVTRAERHDAGERASWVVTVLRGRAKASHEFPPELVDRVLARGPCQEWYTEVSRLLQAAGVAFPA